MIIPYIKPPMMCFSCYKVLPLVYDEALSYYEQICKLYHSVNETIEAVNNLNDAVSTIVDNYEPLRKQVEALTQEMETFENTVNAKVNDMEDRLNAYDDRFDELEDELHRDIDNSLIALKEYVDSKIGDIEAFVLELLNRELEDLYAEIENAKAELIFEVEQKIQELIDSLPDLTTIYVINPVKGYKTNIQTALDDMFMNTRYNALTVDEFNHLKMNINTCNTLMSHSVPRGWSIIEWLTYAKEWLDKNPKHLMNQFITGAVVDFKKNIILNNDLLRVCGCYNCTEYANLGITVDEFNSYNATCEDLAWRSNRIF